MSGLPRVGKTTFMSRLQGKKPLDEYPSTGIENPVSINILEQTKFIPVRITKSRKWEHTNNVIAEAALLLKQTKLFLSGVAAPHILENYTTIKDSTGSLNTPIETDFLHIDHFDDHFSNKPLEITPPAVSEQIVHESSDFKSKFFSAVLANAHSVQHILENFKESTTVYFMDTGGQPEFHELILPILHGPALHLLFFNASLPLHEQTEVKFCYSDEKEMKSVEYTTNYTSIEILNQLLSRLYSLHTDDLSKSVLLGSHIDLLALNESERHNIILKISDILKQDMDTKDYYHNKFLTYPRESDIVFLPIDNKTASENELENIKKFLERVLDTFKEVSLPVSWALFHLMLRYVYEKPTGVCTIKECEDVAEKCGIKRENVKQVLTHLHNNLGTILYYKDVEDLNDLVICDPNVLFHGISHLVTVSFAFSGPDVTLAQQIRNTGEVRPRVLNEAKLHKPNSLLKVKHLINLLTHYKLMKEVERDGEIRYFMPCLLLPDENLTSSMSADEVSSLTNPPPLLIMFQQGFVPLGVFSALIIELSSKWESRKPLFRDHVDFDAQSCTVELRSCFTFLEVRITAHDRPLLCCNNTRNFLKICLEKVLKTQRHTTHVEFLEGFYCPGSFDCQSLHACKYRNTENLVCTATERCHGYRDPFPLSLVKNSKSWFEVKVIISLHNYTSLMSYHFIGKSVSWTNYC